MYTIMGFVHIDLINVVTFWWFNGLGWLHFSSFFSWCLLGHYHIWLQTCYFPVRLKLIPTPEKIVNSHSMFFPIHKSSSFPFYFAQKKIPPSSCLKFVPGKGSVVRENSWEKSDISPTPNQPSSTTPRCVFWEKLNGTPWPPFIVKSTGKIRPDFEK